MMNYSLGHSVLPIHRTFILFIGTSKVVVYATPFYSEDDLVTQMSVAFAHVPEIYVIFQKCIQITPLTLLRMYQCVWTQF